MMNTARIAAVCLHLARAMGVVPSLERFSDLATQIVFGPIVPSQFGLQGRGARDGARGELTPALASLGLPALQVP